MPVMMLVDGGSYHFIIKHRWFLSWSNGSFRALVH